jgi:Big-like domain-containing protein
MTRSFVGLAVLALVVGCHEVEPRGRAVLAVDPSGNGATFVAQDVPATMVAGATYTVFVTMHNAGSSTWTSAAQYRLGAQAPQDNTTWGSGRFELDPGAAVDPGDDATFTMEVSAPAPGTYAFQWQMVQDGVEWFGDFTPLVEVQVVLGPPRYLAPDAVELASHTRWVTLRWSKVEGAAAFDVELDDLTAGTTRATTGLTDTSLSVRVADGHDYVWRVASVDGAGGTSEASSASFSIAPDAPDVIAPTVVLTAPMPGGAASGRVAVNAVASDDRGVKRVTLSVDGHPGRQLTLREPPYLFLWDSRGVADGAHTLQVTAEDDAHNTGSAAVIVMVGNEADAASPCIPPGDGTVGDEVAINAVLSGVGSVARLCPGATYHLTNPIVLTAADQDLHTRGFPAGAGRAKLVVSDGPNATAVTGRARQRVRIRNVEIDGGRGSGPPLDGGDALVVIGGRGKDALLDQTRIHDTRSWSSLHVFEGFVGLPELTCARALVTDNEIGPAGFPGGTWADGISLACRDSRVAGNTITDATDGAIVVFGSPGSRIEDNRVVAASRLLLGGINMVDWSPFSGDYRGTVVTGNVIDAAGAPIKIALAMGLPIWGCVFDDAHRNVGAVVKGNLLTGAYMHYGFVANGVADWTVVDNVSLATHSGVPQSGCGFPVPSAPAAFLMDADHADWTFQPEFVVGQVDFLLNVQ